MAGRQGDSADEQDSADAETVDTQPFFKSKRAAAVLKHAILAKYVVPFAAKTGSTSAGKRGQNQAVEACASTSSVNSSEGFFQL